MKQPNRIRAAGLVLSLALLVAGMSSAILAQDKAKQIDDLIGKYHEYAQFNGAVLVADQGKVIFRKGYGEANKEWNIPNTPDTKFRLGSITKQFTATLILQLAEQGRINLGGKITDYIAEYPKATGDKITISQLLTHSSGIPGYTEMPNFGKEMSRNPFTPMDFIKVFWDLPLQFEPGTKFTYSNSGYFILGVIIEKLTSKPYARVVVENIFKPLGMTNSGYDMPEPVLPKRAAGYQKRGSGYINAPYLDMTVPYSAGSLYSTAEDLYLWDQALYGEKILSEKSKATMFEPRITAGGGPASMRYAYGWFVGKQRVGSSQDSVSVISHGGGINGFNTLITRIPGTKSLVVLLNNTGGAPLGPMAESVLGILYGKPFRPASRPLVDLLREMIRTSGIEAAVSRFNELRTKKDEYSLSEAQMNALGYEYLQEKKLNEAIAVFKLNVESYPKSSNVYDSLGEAYALAGERELAIKNYEKSLELDPASESGIEALKKLKAQ